MAGSKILSIGFDEDIVGERRQAHRLSTDDLALGGRVEVSHYREVAEILASASHTGTGTPREKEAKILEVIKNKSQASRTALWYRALSVILSTEKNYKKIFKINLTCASRWVSSICFSRITHCPLPCPASQRMTC